MTEYEGVVRRLLDGANAAVGDTVDATVPDGRTERGVVMERTVASGPDILVLKLKSGYNVGLAMGPGSKLALAKKADPRVAKPRATPSKDGLPPVAILATGGTIASFVDYRTGAVHPVATPAELAAAVPELYALANVRPRIVFSMFSEDLQPEHWQTLAREVKREFDAGARGVVVTHGTDTMSYTAAALAFFFKDGLPGPVVLVGAQRSSDRPSSDAGMNLHAAVAVAAQSDLGEVVVVMHGETGDNHCLVHRGTRVRKMHSSRRDAFVSINARPLGRVEGGKVSLTEPYRRAKPGPAVLDDRLDEEVSIIQSYPGLWPDHLEKVVLKGVVLVGTGLGHVARRNLDMVRAISTGRHADGSPRLRYDGREAGPSFVVMATQCLNGRVNMNVYSTGRDLLEAGVIPAEDMLAETAYIKLMWVLGRTKDPSEVRRLMRENVVGELDERTPVDAFEPLAP
ncbi:MAG TPA: Glu-tRNA(Gln) amidotransferase subunit GatD [Candidatus Thermoplasmatota archaeon]|nr:Glu-tRNA(Gln) amidotransferase subunit GatD [Candidatus Thermoplasmatota archaeon]